MAVIVTGVGRTAQALGSEVVQIRGAPFPPHSRPAGFPLERNCDALGFFKEIVLNLMHLCAGRLAFGLVWFGLV